jgi:hypothetical protein
MEPREYANDVAIRLGCNVDVGRYVSVTDDLPSAFAPNHAVDVQVEKHIMYVGVSGDREDAHRKRQEGQGRFVHYQQVAPAGGHDRRGCHARFEDFALHE